MTEVVRKIGVLDWVVVGGGLAIIAALELAQTKPFGIDSRNTTPKNAQEALAEWRETAEGGAAFASGSNGAYGWADNHHTVASARTFALAFCAETDPVGCRIVEERDQSEFHATLGQTVSPTTARAFDKFRQYPGAKAFAINQHGYLGYYYGAKTQMGADSGAIAACHRYSNRYPDGIPKQKCSVVYSGW